MTPGLKGSLEARGGVDSNPYFAGEDVPLLNGDTPDSAMFYRLTAFLDWNSPPLGPHWIRLSGFAAQNAYPGSDARDISGLTVAAQAEGVRLLRLGGRTATLRLLAGADSVLLQGGPRMREGAPHIFRRDLFFGGGFAWLISPRLRLGLELEAAQGRFRELARNGWMQTLRVPATIALSESLSLAGGLRCSYHHTDSAYRRWETGLNAAVRWRFFGGLSALAGAGLDWASHPNSSSYFGGDRNREDWTWALRGAVHWQAWPHVQFFVDGEARGRTSTSPGFDFGRFLASGGARWEF
jgi:opacity protein-like surface antigen